MIQIPPGPSALYWFPRIHQAGLPVPETSFFPYSHHEVVPVFEGEKSAEFERLAVLLAGFVKSQNRALFLRTDKASAKHEGPRAYRLDPNVDARRAIYQTLEDSELKFWTEEAAQALMLRPFLELESPFEAFRGLPISREWRFFADADRVLCAHPYWPVGALEGNVNEEQYPDWRAALEALHESPPEYAELESMAIEAARVCGAFAWSVDFCRDVTGKWWLLDMAPMAVSWHWPGCSQK